ncbi:hypothetical protein AKJ49_00370 [candidate division MSBL1 archaeon SCGC-AAA382A03]|uniref:Tetrahydromethanopterin S-methyltransferase subunit H n=1 Tax=candidate division MSBL1 archaeon SCGC-AAA382A03 TaxID=1698278 RepID=A0A133VGT3_9EURY|nr:hypothetical protein AKJ49_00370 [candidate division MSBL1 archaeon SCGC-AAA382A03]
MFKFSKEQKVFDIAGTKIGGQPGEYPTVMVGSIFYEGQGFMKDAEEGKFDKDAARERIQKANEVSQSTGNPHVLDVVGDTPEALIKHIDFVAEETELPFLIDGTTSDVRIPAVKHVGEVGLEDRAIYNTIDVNCDDEEIEALKEAGIKSAILLCYNPNPTIEGRMKSLEKVMDLAEKAEIEKPIVDPSILDLPDPGPVSKMIYRVKKEYGIPAGCGAHNAVDQWSERKEMEELAYTLRTSVANVFPLVMGADFTLYGPIETAKEMFTVCSLADAYVAYSMQMTENMRPKAKEHPLSKVFSN